jgi:hypothetical protein
MPGISTIAVDLQAPPETATKHANWLPNGVTSSPKGSRAATSLCPRTGRRPPTYSGYVPDTGTKNGPRAEEFAADGANRAIMIESTEGGNWLDEKETWDPDDPIRLLESSDQATPKAEAQALWEHRHRWANSPDS